MARESEETRFTWIGEPSIKDDTYAAIDEKTIDWLRRSTNQRANDSRSFINYNLGRIPNQFRDIFINNLTNNWKSGIFELILARYLQEMGAKLYYEKPISGGRRPDFTVKFSGRSIIVEAISPIMDSESIKAEKNNIPLIKYIEKTKPQGWLILLLRLPDIGPADSKKEFKKAINKFFSELSSTTENKLEFTEILSSGLIALDCTRTDKEYKRIGGGPILTSRDDTERRIKHAIDKKRSQVRESNIPVFLAINASGISSEAEDFYHALYGRSVEVVDYITLDRQYSYFEESGLFTKKKNDNPTYAGVLACFKYGLAGGKPPILYLNPNYPGRLPNEILQLEQRSYDFNTQSINIKSSEYNDLVSKLRSPTH